MFTRVRLHQPMVVARPAALAALILVTAAAPATAAPILVKNASFEAQVLAENGFTNNVVTDWVDLTACTPFCYGVANPGVGNPSNPSGVVPDGNNAAYMVSPGGVPMTQTLTATLQGNTTYTLSLYAGNPADRADVGSWGFQLGLLGSSQNVINYSNTLADITNGQFEEFSASVTIAADNVDIGKTLVIRLFGTNNAGPGTPFVSFDFVRLDATAVANPVPEPNALALLSLALLGVGAASRRPAPTGLIEHEGQRHPPH